MIRTPLAHITRLVGRSPAVRFVIIGVAATMVHFGLYFLLLHLGLHYSPAYAIGWAVSLAFNFVATGLFTFRTRLSLRKGALFLLSHAVNFLLHISLLEFFVRMAGISEKIAPIFVLCIAVPINFFMVRFSMRDRKAAAKRDTTDEKDMPSDTML